jgi:hypothetical protein
MTITNQHVPDTDDATMSEPSRRSGYDPNRSGNTPDNIRNARRVIPALAASIREAGVLVPLIVVPVSTVPGDWPTEVTHVAVDGNRWVAAAIQTGALLPCVVRDTVSKDSDAVTMAVSGLTRDGLTGPEQVTACRPTLDLGLSQAAIGGATGMKPKNRESRRPLSDWLRGRTARHKGGPFQYFQFFVICAAACWRWFRLCRRAECL